MVVHLRPLHSTAAFVGTRNFNVAASLVMTLNAKKEERFFFVLGHAYLCFAEFKDCFTSCFSRSAPDLKLQNFPFRSSIRKNLSVLN